MPESALVVWRRNTRKRHAEHDLRKTNTIPDEPPNAAHDVMHPPLGVRPRFGLSPEAGAFGMRREPLYENSPRTIATRRLALNRYLSMNDPNEFAIDSRPCLAGNSNGFRSRDRRADK